ESTLPITEIALSCGFNDANYFSRLFKSKKSKTPHAFRLYPKHNNERPLV
ncbi:MAG: AraC family transcriptional regulator, partial [Vallitaleaceae bacterium]|nr:AraC family transcriptional regulator [Vallitaleaceae bacterium]